MTGYSMREMRSYTAKVDARILMDPKVKHSRVMWECEWTKMKATNECLRTWVEKNGPAKKALDPRDAFYGGRTNATKLLAMSGPGVIMRYADINSLYPSKRLLCPCLQQSTLNTK